MSRLRHRRFRFGMLAAAAALVGACGSDDDASSASVETSETEVVATETVNPEVDDVGGERSSTEPVASSGADGRCVNCAAPPPSGVNAQLSYFTGGSSGADCGVIGEMRGLDDDEFFVGPNRTEVVSGAHHWFCIHGVDPTVAFDFTVEAPDGAVTEFRWAGSARSDRSASLAAPSPTEVGNAFGSLVMSVPPELPTGTYRVVAETDVAAPPETDPVSTTEPEPEPEPESDGASEGTEPDDTATAVSDAPTSTTTVTAETEAESSPIQPPASVSDVSFEVVAGLEPRVESSPPTRFEGESTGVGGVPPGGTVHFLLSGFAPNSTVEPLLYSHTDDEPCGDWYCYAMALPAVTVDGSGAATYSFPTEPGDPLGLYCITDASGGSCTSPVGFSGEFFIGDPFPF